MAFSIKCSSSSSSLVYISIEFKFELTKFLNFKFKFEFKLSCRKILSSSSVKIIKFEFSKIKFKIEFERSEQKFFKLHILTQNLGQSIFFEWFCGNHKMYSRPRAWQSFDGASQHHSHEVISNSLFNLSVLSSNTWIQLNFRTRFLSFFISSSSSYHTKKI